VRISVSKQPVPDHPITYTIFDYCNSITILPYKLIRSNGFKTLHLGNITTAWETLLSLPFSDHWVEVTERIQYKLLSYLQSSYYHATWSLFNPLSSHPISVTNSLLIEMTFLSFRCVYHLVFGFNFQIRLVMIDFLVQLSSFTLSPLSASIAHTLLPTVIHCCTIGLPSRIIVPFTHSFIFTSNFSWIFLFCFPCGTQSWLSNISFGLHVMSYYYCIISHRHVHCHSDTTNIQYRWLSCARIENFQL